MTRAPASLLRRAAELGVVTRYEDVHHEWHDADPAALAVVVEHLDADAARGAGPIEPVHVGTHEVAVRANVRDAHLVLHDGTEISVAPAADRRALTLPPDLPLGCHALTVDTHEGSGECTVVVAPLVMPRTASLARRSGLFVPAYALWDDDEPLASFGLLARLAEQLPALDTHALTTLPLYAAFLDEPFDASPYSPASRLHWNELYISDSALPAAAVPAQGRYVDWPALAARRRAQLLAAVDDLDATTAAALDAFAARRPDVVAFAGFMAGRASARDQRAERSHVLAQFLADRELHALAAGGGATLAIDLPIGCHPAGFERWAHPELFAADMTIGAPPDRFFTAGQDWGLPPPLPAAGRRSGHLLWRELLERAGEHASLVRIDHVMAVHRLWCVPEGFGPHQGVYVRYPREELLAVIAATAAVTDTTVVGEDLGTVPDEVAEALERWQMLGMHEEQFHTDDVPLPAVPARSVAGIRTHDMQPFAAFVEQQGLRLRAYRTRLGRQIGRTVGAGYGEVLDAVLERLAGSDSWLVTVDLDDLTGEREPHNVPGQVLPTNWGRRLERSLTETLADPEVQRRLRLLGARS